MVQSTTRMFAEAAGASEVVRRQREFGSAALDQVVSRLKTLDPPCLVTCARGSSDHAATFGKYLIELKLGIPVSSASPSISSIYGAALKLRGVPWITISQSGQSPDLLSATQMAKEAGAFTVAITNDMNSPLSQIVHNSLDLRAGPETSVAATKTYIATLSLIVGLVANWSSDPGLHSALNELPALLDQSWELDWSLLVDGLRSATSLYVVGRGPGFGIAQEAAIKLKETCGIHAEAYSLAELRHGPLELVKPGFPILVFKQEDRSADGISNFIRELCAQGATVFVAGRAVDGAISLPVVTNCPFIAPIAQIQSFYRAANSLALARGFNPDQPSHISKVTLTH